MELLVSTAEAEVLVGAAPDNIRDPVLGACLEPAACHRGA
jgi:hypothetical protein